MMNLDGPEIASQKAVNAMTLHCTENLQSSEARTRAGNTAVCPANHLAITAADDRSEWMPHFLHIQYLLNILYPSPANLNTIT